MTRDYGTCLHTVTQLFLVQICHGSHFQVACQSACRCRHCAARPDPYPICTVRCVHFLVHSDQAKINFKLVFHHGKRQSRSFQNCEPFWSQAICSLRSDFIVFISVIMFRLTIWMLSRFVSAAERPSCPLERAS